MWRFDLPTGKKFGLCIYLALLCLTHWSVQATSIKLTVGEWPPFIGQHLEDEGVGSKIVKELFRRAGYEVILEFYPWPRAYRHAAEAEKEGSILWIWTEKRAKLFHYSEPVFSSGSYFFMRKSRYIDWNSFKDFKGKVIGIAAGYQYGHDFAQAEKQRLIDTERFNGNDEKLLRLLLGRLDVVVVDYYVAYSILNNYFEPDERAKIKHHPRPIATEGLHLIMPKKSKASLKYLEQFNKKLQEAKDEGYIERMLKKALGGAELP
ncbi:substrate-binding periplasmic protein [Algicola sagamiensis]|uniref:substrate-binding periplasmic protein n=1 Tax=Algicola sagamiensis TaxID=163869 RepID=UPI00037FD04D|nr:transporter substrate-binding domain-containing protein [Algicola sagamiensis]